MSLDPMTDTDTAALDQARTAGRRAAADEIQVLITGVERLIDEGPGVSPDDDGCMSSAEADVQVREAYLEGLRNALDAALGWDVAATGPTGTDRLSQHPEGSHDH